MIKEQKEVHGGWAGIRVPSNENGKAELDLYGEGTVIAIGGNAGKGNIPYDVYGGRRRSDGAGARNRTEIGGKGGNANSMQGPYEIYPDKNNIDDPNINKSQGYDGEDGEDCGIVKINNEVKVYAYGGAGGAGEKGITVGAGRCWWISRCSELVGGRSWTEVGADHCNGAGGYTGAGAEENNEVGINGMGGGGKIFQNETLLSENPITTEHFGGAGGGGYYTKGVGYGNERFGSGAIGGQGGWAWSNRNCETCYDTRGGSRG